MLGEVIAYRGQGGDGEQCVENLVELLGSETDSFWFAGHEMKARKGLIYLTGDEPDFCSSPWSDSTSYKEAPCQGSEAFVRQFRW